MNDVLIEIIDISMKCLFILTILFLFICLPYNIMKANDACRNIGYNRGYDAPYCISDTSAREVFMSCTGFIPLHCKAISVENQE